MVRTYFLSIFNDLKSVCKYNFCLLCRLGQPHGEQYVQPLWPLKVVLVSEEKGSCKSIIITAVDLKLKLLPDLPREAPLSFGHYFKYQYKSSSTYEIFENTML